MVAIGPQCVETVGLLGQPISTGCWLGGPVAVTIGEAILDGVETALIPCRERQRGLHSQRKEAQGREGPIPTALFSPPHCSVQAWWV